MTPLPVLLVRRTRRAAWPASTRCVSCPACSADWTLVREWGRVGSPGRVRVDAFATEDASVAGLERLARRKRGRGYADSPAPPVAADTERPRRGRA